MTLECVSCKHTDLTLTLLTEHSGVWGDSAVGQGDPPAACNPHYCPVLQLPGWYFIPSSSVSKKPQPSCLCLTSDVPQARRNPGERDVYPVGEKTRLDVALEAGGFRIIASANERFRCTAGLCSFADSCQPTGLWLHGLCEIFKVWLLIKNVCLHVSACTSHASWLK